MPLFTSLVDNFNDNTLGPNWGDSYGGVTETGGRARVPCVAATYAGYQTGRAWTLDEASIYAALLTRPAVSGATEAYTTFQVTASTAGTSAGFTYNAVGGQLRLFNNVDYWDDTPTLLTYSATTHKWLRLRETAGTLYWDTSADGTTWTNRRSITTPAWIAAAADNLALDMFAYRSSGTTDYVEYDNLNTLNDGATLTGSGSGSAQTTATSAGTRTALATVSAAATSGASITATGTYYATAYGEFTADAQATPAGATSSDDIAVRLGKPRTVWEVGAPWT